MIKVRFLLLALALSSCSSGGEDSPSLSTNACGVIGLNPKVVNGTACHDDQSPVVGIQIEDRNGGAICSGTLITPSHILTAAHCFIENSYTGAFALIGGEVAQISKVTIHPAARVTSGSILNDLAILTLRTPSSLPTMPIAVTTSPDEGDVLSVYGYGLDESNNVGVLRSGQTRVESVDANYIITIYDGEGSDPCFGDSGSPGVILADSALGERAAIAGVLSAGSNTTCAPTDRNAYVNIQSYLDFIASTAPGAEYL